MRKRLYRSNSDVIICGVCGGIAEYFDIDPSFVRIGTLVLCLGWGTGLIAYLVAACIVPKNPY